MDSINELATLPEIRVFGSNGSRNIVVRVCRKVFESVIIEDTYKSDKDKPVFFAPPKKKGIPKEGEGTPKVFDSKSLEGPFAKKFILPRNGLTNKVQGGTFIEGYLGEFTFDSRVYLARQHTGNHGYTDYLLPRFR